MKMTAQLKAWLVEHCGVKADASDAEFKKAAADALLDGTKLTAAKLVELTADPDAKSANSLETMLNGLLTHLNAKGAGEGAAAATGAAAPSGTKAAGASEGQVPDANAVAGGAALSAANAGGDKGVSLFEKVFAGANDVGTQTPQSMVRVKGAHEQYSATKGELSFPKETTSGGRHPYAGQRAFIGEGANRKLLDTPSQREKALSGAFIKFQLQGEKNLHPSLRMTEHEKDLMQYALKECEWVGTLGGDGDSDNSTHLRKGGQKLNDMQIKSLIDDTSSGGNYAAPIFFDDQIIQVPILYGEFFPAVEVVPITRGRTIQGASIAVQTISGGGFDATDIPLFTTTAFIAAFNTTIYVANAAIEIGMDFLSDSPVDVAGIVTEQYGRVLLNYLDKNICAGDGTTQPTGISVASGTTSVAGGSTTPTVGVYESFLFGVTKKYKQGYAPERIMFGANETTYQRARAIAVGASDARRVFGMNHESYTIFDRKYGISDTLGNTKAFFGNLARYRMYRRLGQTLKVTTDGKTLVRGNLMLITARSRWGGQPTDGAAFAYSSTMQA